jgi:hypothetical protein
MQLLDALIKYAIIDIVAPGGRNMSIIHIVTFYSNAGADPASPQDMLSIYRFAIESRDRGELIASNCMSGLSRAHSGLDFSYDIRAIIFWEPETQISEILSEILEVDP